MPVDFDAFDSIGDLNAVLKPLVETQNLGGLVDQLLPAIDTCISELALSLVTAQKVVTDDSQTQKFIVDALISPFNSLGNALATLLVPNPEEFTDNANFASYVTTYAKQVLESAKSPIAAMVASQASIFTQSLEELGQIFFAGGALESTPGRRGVLTEIYDRSRYIFRELFIDPQQAGANFGGLFIYAMDEVMPAIDAELRYLKRMKRSVFQTIEEGSKLPPSMVPQLPNTVVSNVICNAEGNLDVVIADLRYRQRWNRGEFAAATAKICQAKDIIFSGVIPDDLRYQLKQLFGWDDRQINAVSGLKFMPDADYRVKTVELVALNNFIQDQNVHVLSFHKNLTDVLATLEGIFTVGLGDALALIIEVIKRQIKILRADLEAQSAGFTGILFADFPDAADPAARQTRTARNDPHASLGLGQSLGIQVPDSIEGKIRHNKRYAVDVYAHLTAQASAYTVLSGLCFVMERVQRFQSTFQTLLTANNRFVKVLREFVLYYSAEDCGNADGAKYLNDTLEAFLSATEARLRGETNSNAFLSARGKDLLRAIELHEQFLVCMRDRLFFGNQKLLKAVNIGTQVAEAAENIAALVREVGPDVLEAVRTLDFKRLIQGDDVEFNVLDSVMRSLQCLVLQCDNQFVHSTARLAERQFRPYIGKRFARRLTMGSLDDVPRASHIEASNARQQAFFQVIRSLQRLTSFDINELCEIDTEGQPSNAVPPPAAPVAATATVDDTASRAARERAEARSLAAQEASFSSSASLDRES